MKKQFLALLLSVFISIPALSQVSIGYMNPAEVLASLDEVQQIDATIDSLISARDLDLINKSNQLQQDIAAYEEGQAVLSADARATREQELLDRSDALEEERNNALNEIRQRRVQLLSPIMERMDMAIQKVATQKGLDLVLNELTSYGDAIIFYSDRESNDITEAVIAELKADNSN